MMNNVPLFYKLFIKEHLALFRNMCVSRKFVQEMRGGGGAISLLFQILKREPIILPPYTFFNDVQKLN